MDGTWIRPVSANDDGSLSYAERILHNGKDPELLDLISIPLERHAPEPDQPENWLITGEGWGLQGSLTAKRAEQLFDANLFRGRDLFGYTSHDQLETTVQEDPIDRSLLLIEPDSLRLAYEPNPPRLAYRAYVTFAGKTYDLGMTDPATQAIMETLGKGNYGPDLGGKRPASGRTFLCVSLGGVSDGRSYRLVEGVITIA